MGGAGGRAGEGRAGMGAVVEIDFGSGAAGTELIFNCRAVVELNLGPGIKLS